MVNQNVENQQKDTHVSVGVPLNDVVMQICQGIVQMRKAEVDVFNSDELICYLEGENKLYLNMEQFHTEEKEVKKKIRHSQVQLFIYLLHTWRNASSDEFTLDLAGYYSFRGISRRTSNNKQLTEDLEVLQSLSIEMEGKDSNTKEKVYQVHGQLLQFEKEGKDFRISMGDWINHLSRKKYTQLHKNFFRYHAKKESNAILLSLKLAQLFSLQRNKVKVKTLLDFLGITDKQIKKQGGKRYAQLLENAFELLSKEGYHFNPLSTVHDEGININTVNVHFWNILLQKASSDMSNEVNQVPNSNSKVG